MHGDSGSNRDRKKYECYLSNLIEDITHCQFLFYHRDTNLMLMIPAELNYPDSQNKGTIFHMGETPLL